MTKLKTTLTLILVDLILVDLVELRDLILEVAKDLLLPLPEGALGITVL